MDDKFIEFIKKEKELTERLLLLSGRLKDALLKHRQDLVEKISNDQQIISAKLKEMEERRIGYMMSQFSISRVEAAKVKLSEIEEKSEGDKKLEIKRVRIAMKKIVDELNELNSTNRILANKAKNSVGNIINSLNVKNGRKVCDVKV